MRENLDEMLEQGIMITNSEATDWVSSLPIPVRQMENCMCAWTPMT